MGMIHARMRTRFGGLERGADAGWQGYTLPMGPKGKANVVIDVPRKNRNMKKNRV